MATPAKPAPPWAPADSEVRWEPGLPRVPARPAPAGQARSQPQGCSQLSQPCRGRPRDRVRAAWSTRDFWCCLHLPTWVERECHLGRDHGAGLSWGLCGAWQSHWVPGSSRCSQLPPLTAEAASAGAGTPRSDRAAGWRALAVDRAMLGISAFCLVPERLTSPHTGQPVISLLPVVLAQLQPRGRDKITNRNRAVSGLKVYAGPPAASWARLLLRCGN